MSDPQNEIRLWLINSLKAMGHGAKGKLAAFLDVRPDVITRMMNTDPAKETRQIRAHELERMREFFASDHGEGPETDSHGSVVPLMGYLGAGAEVDPDFEQVPPEGLDQIHLPILVPDDMIAFKVRGDSMLPAFKDGAIIVVYREQMRPLEAFYGEEAAVRTSDGRRYIKTIMRGRDGLVNLFSWNASPIEDIHLEWIGEIFAVLPPAALRKSVRQRGIQGQLRLNSA